MAAPVVLIAGPTTPPRSVQGLGLPYLAAVLEEAGIRVVIRDVYPATPDKGDPEALDRALATAVAQEGPLLVGLTIHTPAYAERVRLARCLREQLPDTLLVAGGHHPSSEPAHLLRHSDFDVCVIGEGEHTLLEIVQAAAQGHDRRRTGWLGAIRGVVYHDRGRVVRTAPRRAVADLDSLPPAAHHLLGLADYAPHPLLGVRSTGIITYRGCPEGCAFCCNPQGHRVRLRSPSRVVDEMAWVAGELGVSGFNVYDNLFGLSREHALAVCDEIIQRRLQVTWDCWTAGDLVDAQLAARMRAAGCIRVGFGAESGDDAVLSRSQRGFSSAAHVSGLRTLRAAGLKVSAFLMVGLPGDTEESVRRTVEFAMRCGADDVTLGIVRPFPGAPLWRRPGQFGVRLIRGPNFEAYIETEALSRAAIIDLTERAGEALGQQGIQHDFLRCDRYAWE
jgi:radical SAM superfamily enzyme YgiQ (UPF0313 family)